MGKSNIKKQIYKILSVILIVFILIAEITAENRINIVMAAENWKTTISERINQIQFETDFIYECGVDVNDLKISNTKVDELEEYINNLACNNLEFYWIDKIYVLTDTSGVIDLIYVWAKDEYINENGSIDKVQAKVDLQEIQRRLDNGELYIILEERLKNLNIYDYFAGSFLIDISDLRITKDMKEEVMSYLNRFITGKYNYYWISKMWFEDEKIRINPKVEYREGTANEYDSLEDIYDFIIDGITNNTNLYTYKLNIEQSIKDYFEFEEKIKSFLNQLDDNMSDIEIVLAAHEWVTRECEYDYHNYLYDTIPSISYTYNGVIDKGIAVCAGYAATMNLLLDWIGIENYEVASKEMDHGWNVVKIDGEYYHLDATWDDCGRDDLHEGYKHNKYFIKSDEEISNLNHYNWKRYGGYTLPECTSENSYEGYIFRDNSSYINLYGVPLNYNDGYWYYNDFYTIIKSKIDGTQKSTFRKYNSGIVNSFIYKDYMYIAIYEGKVYKIDMNNPNNEEVIFDIATDNSIGTTIKEFVVKQNIIKIDGDSGSKIISLKGKASTIELNKDSVDIENGTAAKLSVTVYSENQSDIQWASSNPSIIEVDDNGNITAKSEGTATIFAAVDGVVDTCVVNSKLSYINGDVNNDEKVNSKDVVMMKKYLAGYSVNMNADACDVNNDSKVNSKDVVMIMKYLAGYDVKLQ